MQTATFHDATTRNYQKQNRTTHDPPPPPSLVLEKWRVFVRTLELGSALDFLTWLTGQRARAWNFKRHYTSNYAGTPLSRRVSRLRAEKLAQPGRPLSAVHGALSTFGCFSSSTNRHMAAAAPSTLLSKRAYDDVIGREAKRSRCGGEASGVRV